MLLIARDLEVPKSCAVLERVAYLPDFDSDFVKCGTAAAVYSIIVQYHRNPNFLKIQILVGGNNRQRARYGYPLS